MAVNKKAKKKQAQAVVYIDLVDWLLAIDACFA
jgi:hypothetical protein